MSRPKHHRRRAARNKSKSALNPETKEGSPMAAHALVPQFAPTRERARRGDIATVELVETVLAPSDRDETGDRAGGRTRRVLMGVVTRDFNAYARTRLARYDRLSEEQIEAGGMLEDDYERGGLSPRVTANLQGAGGGGAVNLADGVLAARTRFHQALRILDAVDAHGATPTVKSVVEAVVLHGSRVEDAGAGRYKDRPRTLVFGKSMLEFGLNLLAAHYRNCGRLGRKERA